MNTNVLEQEATPATRRTGITGSPRRMVASKAQASIRDCSISTLADMGGAVVNAARIAELMSYDQVVAQPVFSRLVEDFLECLWRLEPKIIEYWEAQDLIRLSEAAHNLKGCSLNIGADQLGALCREIEAHAKASDRQAVESAIVSLGQASRLTEYSLRRMLRVAA